MNFQQAFAKFISEQNSEPQIQLVFLTFTNGQQVLALAPVIHDPDAGVVMPELQSVEVADIVPRTTGLRLINGDFKPSWVQEQ